MKSDEQTSVKDFNATSEFCRKCGSSDIAYVGRHEIVRDDGQPMAWSSMYRCGNCTKAFPGFPCGEYDWKAR